MDGPFDSLAQIAATVINLMTFLVFVPVIRFAYWSLVYTTGSVLLRILYKTRREVFNLDRKYNRAECENKVIIITGATSGIGLANAHHFHDKNFVIIACYYSKHEPGYKELVDIEVESSKFNERRSMYLVELDVRSSDSIVNCYHEVVRILSREPTLKLHAIVNVAGVGYFYKFQWIPKNLIENLVKTNLLGPILFTRQFMHLLIRNKSSRVVNVASPMAFIPTEYNSIYGATKAGLTQFSNALEIEMLRYGLKTITIHPGNVIRNTSILNSSMLSKLDQILPELNAEERSVYGNELNKHLERMIRVERAFKKKPNITISRGSLMTSNLVKIGLMASGAVETTKLHCSDSFMQSFDNSIRLEDPPKEMFAGNMFFNLVVSSTFDTLGRAFCRDMFLTLRRNRYGVLL